MKANISFERFQELSKELDIRPGKIIKVQSVPKSTKLIQLTVDFGLENTRTVVTNIGQYLPDPLNDLHLRVFLFVVNLEPVKIMGIESTAMILPGMPDKNAWLEIDYNSCINSNAIIETQSEITAFLYTNVELLK